MSTSAAPASPRTELDFGALLKRSWALFAARPVEHVVAAVVVTLLGGITLGILLGPLLASYIRLIDRQQAGEPIAVGDLFELGGTAGTAILAWFLLAVGVTIGLLLAVLPGLVLLFGWGYCFWFVALERTDAWDALGASWRLARQHLGSVVVVWVVLLLLSAFGSAVFLGFVVTMPIGMSFATLAFRELRR